MTIRYLWVILGFTCLVSCSSDSEQSIFEELSNIPSQTLEAQWQNVLDTSADEYDLTGVIAVVTAPGGSRTILTTGVSDLVSSDPIRIENRHKIGTVTESFVAYVVLGLVQEGLISLDETIGDFAPFLEERFGTTLPLAWLPITVRQLLTHRSGLPDYFDDALFRSNFLQDPLLRRGPETLIATVAAQDLVFEPGTSWNYSHTDYVFLGLFAEVVTNSPIELLVESLAITPAALISTNYAGSAVIDPPFNRGYFDGFADRNGDGTVNISDQNAIIDAFEESTFTEPSNFASNGTMVSTATDLATWVAFLVNGGQLEQNTAALLTSFEDTVEGYPRQAIGLLEESGWIGYTGRIFGYNTAVFTRQGQTWVVLTLGEIPLRTRLLFDDLVALEIFRRLSVVVEQ
jgi:D-alanyl-D-alanine carboxypeptidase